MPQKLTSEMSIIIFQETALGFDCTKNFQFLKRKKLGHFKYWAFLNIRHFNMICQHTKFSQSCFQAEAVRGAYKLIIFSVKEDQSSMSNSSVSAPNCDHD